MFYLDVPSNLKKNKKVDRNPYPHSIKCYSCGKFENTCEATNQVEVPCIYNSTSCYSHTSKILLESFQNIIYVDLQTELTRKGCLMYHEKCENVTGKILCIECSTNLCNREKKNLASIFVLLITKLALLL